MNTMQMQIGLFVGVGLLMVLHADRRFNTPLRNRSTTRRHLYQRARLSYICVTVLVLFIAWGILDFSKVFSEEPPVLKLLIALVFLTDGIPHLPFLSEIDRTLLEFFRSVANIPQEVQRCAEQLKPELLRVEADDLPTLTSFIEEEGALPNELRSHLRSYRGDQVETSEYRFTRVLKLYKGLVDFASLSKYERFFGDYAEEWKQAQQDFQSFCHRSVTSLELATKYQAEDGVVLHRELLEDIRENFRLRCRERFTQLGLLLAGALVSSMPDEEHLAAALHQVGFDVNYEKAVEFPLDELSQLAVILFVCVFTAYAWIPLLLSSLGSPTVSTTTSLLRVMWPLLIVLSYITGMVVTITWLVSHPRVLTRQTRPWGKYIVCAALAGLSVAVLCCIFVAIRYLTNRHVYWTFIPRMSLAIAALCFVVAVLCERDVADDDESRLRHFSEGLMVAVTMLVAEVVLDRYIGPLPLPRETMLSASTITFTLIIPSMLAAIVGFWVPHMYRMSCRFAQSPKTAEQEPVELPRLRVGRAAVRSDTLDPETTFA